MSPSEAARILELPENASSDQVESRFLEMRRKLEDKIARAPTPGLQAKYRESLTTLTTAFETLVLAADSSALPVLQRQGAARDEPGAGGSASPRAGAGEASAPQSPESGNRKSRIENQKSGKEFLIVAVIAVAVLGAGGWWVMKTRAENAEKARVAAEAQLAAKAAADEQAAADKRAQEERARRISQLRTRLAAAGVAWEAVEHRAQLAERRLNETKGELRGFRDGPEWKKAELSALAHRQELYVNWLTELLSQHPAKIARVTAGQLLTDGLPDEAERAVEEMERAIGELQEYMAQRAALYFEGTAEVKIQSEPAGVKFAFTDAYGRVTEGVTPATLPGQPLSHIHDPKFDGDAGDTEVAVGELSVEPSVRFSRVGWPDVVKTGRTSPGGGFFSAEFPQGQLEIRSQPAGMPFEARNQLGWSAAGKAPATLEAVPPGSVSVRLLRPGFKVVEAVATVVPGKLAQVSLDQRSPSVEIAVAEAKSKIFVDGKFVGYERAVVNDLVPGEHALQLEAEGYAPFRVKFTVNQEAVAQKKSYSFKQLAVENITCESCKGAGKFNRQEVCSSCRGTQRIKCYDCPGNGIAGYVQGDYGGGVIGPKMVRCETCGGKGKLPCDSCRDGRVYWSDTCNTCAGDGRVSRLQLSR